MDVRPAIARRLPSSHHVAQHGCDSCPKPRSLHVRTRAPLQAPSSVADFTAVGAVALAVLCRGRKHVRARQLCRPAAIDSRSGPVEVKAPVEEVDEKVAQKAEKLKSERRGRRGQDMLVTARLLGLNSVELAGAIFAGPAAFYAYPTLRALEGELLRADGDACLKVLGFCGGVPPSLAEFFTRTVGLLFSFVLGYTYSTLVLKIEALYAAIYEETALLTQLLEEAPLFLPRDVLLKLAKNVRRYLAAGWYNPSILPSELVARSLRSDRDAVEEITRILVVEARDSEGRSDLLTCVRALRIARAKRMAATQRTIPTVQFLGLVMLGFLQMLSPFLDGSTESSSFAQFLFALLVTVIIVNLLLVQDLADPSGSGFYSTINTSSVILDAIEDLLDQIEEDKGANKRVPADPVI